MAGFSMVEVKPVHSDKLGDKGARFKGSFIGVLDLTQRLSVVLSLGYHNNLYYGQYLDSSVAGVTAVAALRINIFGTNRDIESSY